ncbi:MAG: hypothetical protein WD017_08645, partial [Cucumibacter sp.]
MTRYILWIVGGLFLGAIVHLVVILVVPLLAERNVWAKVSAMDALEKVALIEAPVAGEPNSFDLDPGLLYAVCRLNIAEGPGALEGELPASFWSIAVFEPGGTIVYSTTNRASNGRSVNLGIFNPAQTRLLADQQLQIEDGLLIVESPGDVFFVLVR